MTAVVPTSLQDRLNDRVRGFLVDALTDEEIKAYVDRAVAEFINGWTEVTRGTYPEKKEHQPMLPKLVRDVVHAQMQERVIAEVKKILGPILDVSYQTDEVAKKVREELMAQIAPALLDAMVKTITAPLFLGMAGELQDRLKRLGG